MAELQQPSKPNEIRPPDGATPGEARAFTDINSNFDRIYRYLRASLQNLTTFIGILPQENGGTGIDSSGATNGQLLIGRTSDHSLRLATLTAGANIAITNGAGSIEVAVSGSTGLTHSQVLAKAFQVTP